MSGLAIPRVWHRTVPYATCRETVCSGTDCPPYSSCPGRTGTIFLSIWKRERHRKGRNQNDLEKRRRFSDKAQFTVLSTRHARTCKVLACSELVHDGLNFRKFPGYSLSLAYQLNENVKTTMRLILPLDFCNAFLYVSGMGLATVVRQLKFSGSVSPQRFQSLIELTTAVGRRLTLIYTSK